MATSVKASARIKSLYDKLPADARRDFVEKHLIPLLDKVPKETSKNKLLIASSLRKRYTGIPLLDPKAKKAEIDALLGELNRDSKRSFVQEHSDKEDLLMEIIDSVTDWLNDIWIVVYEYRTNFSLAHSCLLFAVEVLEHIQSPRSGCKCAFLNIFIPVSIKNKSGKQIKSFTLTGANNLDVAILWVWRELFVSLLETKRRGCMTPLITEMLGDINTLMGWPALQRLLYGGKKASNAFVDDIYDNGDDCYDDEDDDDGDDSNGFEGTDRCRCPLHAIHWSEPINNQRLVLREYVQISLTSLFKLTPSLQLYTCIQTVSEDEAIFELLELLESNATNSPESFAAALDIYSTQGMDSEILELLDSHSHFLRPRDAPILQRAVTAIAENSFDMKRSLQIAENELFDTIRSVQVSAMSCFSRIDIPVHKAEFNAIIKLRTGSSTRQERVSRWVDAVITPGAAPPHPVAVAALMMGFPLAPGMEDSEDVDPFGYLDLHQDDPDLEDLREEYRPQMKDRFEGWVETTQGIDGGSAVLVKVFKQALEMMPFLRAHDAVEEMIERLSERPSRHHVCDVLGALSSFCQHQRKRLALMAEGRKKKAESWRSRAPSTPTPGGFSFTFAGLSPFGPPQAESSRNTPPLGMEMEGVD